MRKIAVAYWGVLLGVFLAVSPVFANHGEHGKQCSMSGGGRSCGNDSDCESLCPIASKVLKKAKFFLENQTEIGLSEDQLSQIKAIKMQTKKSAIKAKAEMEIFEMDMSEKMSQSKVDVDALGAMVDQMSAGMSTGAKASIADYAKLKSILSEQQMAKAKEIWKKKN
jgi:chorismate synthase